MPDRVVRSRRSTTLSHLPNGNTVQIPLLIRDRVYYGGPVLFGFNILYTSRPSPEEIQRIADAATRCPRTYTRWDGIGAGHDTIRELDVVHFAEPGQHEPAPEWAVFCQECGLE